MRVVGYVRVSTGVQAEKGISIPEQEKGIRAWCRANGHKLVTIERDSGISGGTEPSDRAGLSAALAMVDNDRAQAIVAKDLTRIARSLTVQEAALASLWHAGGRMFTYENGEVMADDPDDPMRTAMRQMMGVFSELERQTIAKRLRDGRRAKADRGGYAYGSPAYGTHSVSGTLTKEEREQAAIVRICELHSAGASLREIADILAIEGHQPKRGAKGSKWHPQTVSRILARLETK